MSPSPPPLHATSLGFHQENGMALIMSTCICCVLASCAAYCILHTIESYVVLYAKFDTASHTANICTQLKPSAVASFK